MRNLNFFELKTMNFVSISQYSIRLACISYRLLRSDNFMSINYNYNKYLWYINKNGEEKYCANWSNIIMCSYFVLLYIL